MKLKDGRKLSFEHLHERRKQSVMLHKKGESNVEIARLLGVHRVTVGRWLTMWREDGAKVLKPRRRGVTKGAGRSLTPKQENRIKGLIVDRLPDQLKMPFALWTREAVAMLIEREAGVKMPVRTVGDYLKRWGMTPQKPVKRAYERSEPAVKRWLETDYPAIKARAKACGAEIHWADETGINSSDNRGRGFAPKGKTPVRRHKGTAEKANMISSVTNKGKLRFMFYGGRFNQHVLMKYLKRLISEAAGRPLVVIMDNHPSHHGKLLKEWAEENSKLIVLEYLPSYAPDLNPDEFLNCDLKAQISKRPDRREKGTLRKTATSVLRSLQKRPARVASYFEAEDIAYAA
jgi:transposase